MMLTSDGWDRERRGYKVSRRYSPNGEGHTFAIFTHEAEAERAVRLYAPLGDAEPEPPTARDEQA